MRGQSFHRCSFRLPPAFGASAVPSRPRAKPRLRRARGRPRTSDGRPTNVRARARTHEPRAGETSTGARTEQPRAGPGGLPLIATAANAAEQVAELTALAGGQRGQEI